MKRIFKYIAIVLMAVPMACSQDEVLPENADENTTKEEEVEEKDKDEDKAIEGTILGYIRKHDECSQYASLLEKVSVTIDGKSTTVSSLLSSKGGYTAFVPTNSAIQVYLDSLQEEGRVEKASWEGLDNAGILDSIRRVIVLNSIIPAAIPLKEFPPANNREISWSNLNGERLSVQYNPLNPDEIFIDNNPISLTEREIKVNNGFIYQMEGVIAPKDNTVKGYIQDYLRKDNEGYRVMFRVIEACGLLNEMAIWRDLDYEDLYWTGQFYEIPLNYYFNTSGTAYPPQHRYIGYTIFAETDDFWRSNGIDPNAADLCSTLTSWIKAKGQYSDSFTTDGNYASPQHLLYQWATYHILPMRLTPDKLVNHINEYGFSINNPSVLGIPVCEYYTTMGKRRLFKLYESKESNGVYINRFPILDNDRQGTGHEIGCDPDKMGVRIDKDSPLAVTSNVNNACIYPIDAPISYSNAVRHNLASERIRFDVMSLFPEAMTNNIRLNQTTYIISQNVSIPSDYSYFENMHFNNRSTTMVYFNAWNMNWCNLQSDELKAVGLFDVTIKLPPVPEKGTYELRYKCLANDNRGIAQVFFGSDIERMTSVGMPLDLTLGFHNTNGIQKTGWDNDTDDEVYNAIIDKTLHNNGYMKGAQSIYGDGYLERSNRRCIRHILLEQTLDPDKTYYVRFKSALDSDRKELHLDYLEWCPKSVYHDRYQPEDIW